MTRSVVAKAARLAKGMALFGGLVVTFALVLGVGTVALAAVPGDPFRLGSTNRIDGAFTKIVGSYPGDAILKVDNESSASGSRALDLRVEAGRAPIDVNAEAGKAANLNADEVDGEGAGEIGVNGLEKPRVLGVTNSESLKSESVGCPPGKVVIGGGAEISGGQAGAIPDQQTRVALTGVRISQGAVIGIASEVRAFGGDWGLNVTAVCATEGTP